MLFAGLSVSAICAWFALVHAARNEMHAGAGLALAFAVIPTLGAVALFSACGLILALIAEKRREGKLARRIGLVSNLVLAAVPIGLAAYLALPRLLSELGWH